MIPCHCRVKHDPPNSYGDCVRACIASLMDVADPETVPHFWHDNDSAAAIVRLRAWLAVRDFLPFTVHHGPDVSLGELHDAMRITNPGVYYMLFGQTAAGGDHVVICRDGRVEHDPAWSRSAIVGPASNGVWSIMVLVRL